ncbi:MAG: SDR family oxidoreductase [Candidatus Eisenbacteria bacterium]|nr:SDR family oxidoreductase [Candidatus Eisenbacteria bacterium]
MMKLKGRVALVTGGARRIGRTLVEALAERGASVALHYHTSAAQAREVRDRLRGAGRTADIFRADLGRPRGAEALARRVEERLGPVDVLVNSASVYERTPLAEFRPADWDRTLNINLRGPALLARRLGLEMKQRGRGAIVNIGDWSIDRPYPGYAAYAASKAGLRAVTRILARELAPEVTVNMVSPGAILPYEGASEHEMRAMRKAAALKKLGDPEDIAAAILYLVEGSGYSTGTEIIVDGGRSLR